MAGSLRNNQAGFTIIELLIASLVFSVILIIVTSGIIQVTRTYIRGYVSSETQNTDRAIVDQITQAIQQAASGTISINGPSGNLYWFCINGSKYTYTYKSELDGAGNSDDVFIVNNSDGNDCTMPDSLSSPNGAKELLSGKMEILPPTGGGSILKEVNVGNQTLYSIELSLLYGDPGTYNSNYGCESISSGGDFCSTSTISTTVEQRTNGPVN